MSTKSPTPQCFLLTKKVSFEGAVKGQQANVWATYPCLSTPIGYVHWHLQLPGWRLIRKCGRVWLIALVLKTSVPERVPWVRILPLPPLQSECLIVSYETLASQGLIWHRNQSKHLVVIGPCAYCAAADVKEAVWRVRSQLTVGRLSSDHVPTVWQPM